MSYRSIDQLEQFDFHDSDWKLNAREGDAVTFAVEKLNIHKWQAKVPDMSKVFPRLMPPKNLSGDYIQRLPIMIHETCVAETTHIVVSILGLPCLRIWPGIGGVTVTTIFIVFLNVPYILIQRYNRPRLIRLQKKAQTRKEKKEGTLCVF